VVKDSNNAGAACEFKHSIAASSVVAIALVHGGGPLPPVPVPPEGSHGTDSVRFCEYLGVNSESQPTGWSPFFSVDQGPAPNPKIVNVLVTVPQGMSGPVGVHDE
jgi:hypothetical protein